MWASPFVIALFGALSFAQSGQAGSPDRFASVEGRVVHSQSGEPIARAEASLFPIAANDPAPFVAATDSEGKFRLTDIPPGRYQLGVFRRGFLRGQFGRRGGPLRGGSGGELALVAGQTMSGIEVKLVPQGVAAGRVFDDLGEPADKVRIQIAKWSSLRAGRRLTGIESGLTNDLGEFRIAGLAPGRYLLWAEGTAMGGTLRPRWTGPKPASELIQTFFPGVSGAATARAIEIAAGQVVEGLDFRMIRASLYRIRGKVTAPREAGRISLLLMSADSGSSFDVNANAEGAFEIGGVSAGKYMLYAADRRSTIAGRTDILVRDADLEAVDVVLAPCAVLRGTVVVKGQPKGAGKPRLSRVRLIAQEGPIRELQYSSTSDGGEFTMQNVPPGRFRLVVDALPPQLWVESVRFGDQVVPPAGFEIGPGMNAMVEIVLGTGFGRVSGVVVDSEQRPAAGVPVVVAPDPFAGEDQAEKFRLVTTDQNGRFQTGPLPPGEYRAYAWDEVEDSDALDPEFLKKFEDRSRKVTVKLDAEERLELKVIVSRTP